MTLIITFVAAVICSVLKRILSNDNMRLGTLALIFWGASLMWLVDAFFEGREFISSFAENITDDTLLGISVVASGLIIWLIILLIDRRKNRIKNK